MILRAKDGDILLTTAEVARRLHAHPKELFLAAARLGAVPGQMLTGAGAGRQVHRLWRERWVEPLRREVNKIKSPEPDHEPAQPGPGDIGTDDDDPGAPFLRPSRFAGT